MPSHTLPCPTIPRHVLTHPVMPYHTMPCPTLPYPSIPYYVPLCPAIPYRRRRHQHRRYIYRRWRTSGKRSLSTSCPSRAAKKLSARLMNHGMLFSRATHALNICLCRWSEKTRTRENLVACTKSRTTEACCSRRCFASAEGQRESSTSRRAAGHRRRGSFRQRGEMSCHEQQHACAALPGGTVRLYWCFFRPRPRPGPLA
jgi:hypothetical protein